MIRAVHVAPVVLMSLAPGVAAQQPVTDTVLVPVNSSPAAISRFEVLQRQVSAAPAVLINAPGVDDSQTVTSRRIEGVRVRPASGPTSEVAAVRVPTGQITAIEQNVSELLAKEPASAPSFLRTLERKYSAKNTPVLGVTWAATAASVSGVAAQGHNGRVADTASMAVDLLRAKGQGLLLRTTELQLLMPAKAGFDSATAAFDRRYNATLASLTNAIETPTPANQQAFQANARLTRAAFVEIWPQLRNDPAKRRDAVRRLAGLMEQSSLKAVYGLTSNFDPVSYSRIFSQARRTVALVERNERFCSGYLLSAEWVMTAGHCLKRGDVQSMRASISTAAGEPVLVPVDDQWPTSGTGRSDADPIDYVFLHLAPSDELQRQWAWLEQARLCLQPEPLEYEQAVFVIAHRGESPLKVYDHAYVWFPFRALPQRFQEMSALTGAKLQRLAEAWFPDDPTRQVDFFDRNMADLEKSYELRGTHREYRSERAGLGKRPYFGMDTDTYRGNSGAPVFSRDGVCIIGVFSGGAADNARIDEGTWKEHEFAIPLPEIAAHLRSLDVAADSPTPERKASREALVAMMPN